MPVQLQQTRWEKTKSGSKAGFDKVYGWVDKLGAPVNRLSNKVGSEAFWPTTLDKESDKAARILKSFCKDGFYEEEARPTSDAPKAKQRVLKKIPAEVIRNAKGLAIFTTMRTGLWVSGAGGAGIVLARLPDGTWSPPSGIMLHTAGLGFLVGVDIYDCVVVINTVEAMQAFSKLRCTLGGEVSAVAGPLGVGGLLETEVHKRQAPIFTYLKSRGFYAGVQIDGTVVIERTDENERFYGQRISVAQIFAGEVRHPPFELRMLFETIKAAEGNTNIDESLMPEGAPPADFEIVEEGHIFGVPDREDPDPYGVLALEKAGLEIREAGTNSIVRPTSSMFAFAPSPSSPIFPAVNRRSWDNRSINSSRRTSQMSFLERPHVQMSDMSTQTDFDSFPVQRPASIRSSRHDSRNPSPEKDENKPTLQQKRTPPALPPRQSIEIPYIPEEPKPEFARKRSQSPASLHSTPSIEINSTPLESNSTPLESNFKETEYVSPAPIAEEPSYMSPPTSTPQSSTKTSDSEPQINGHTESTKESIHDSVHDQSDSESDHDDDDDDDDEEIEDVEIVTAAPIQHIQRASSPQIINRSAPRIVTVSKPAPPKLPPRSPFRSSASSSLHRPGSPLRSSVEVGSSEAKDAGIGAEMDNAERSPVRGSNKSTDESIRSRGSVDSVGSSVARLRVMDDENEDVHPGHEQGNRGGMVLKDIDLSISPSKENDDLFHSANVSPVKEKHSDVDFS